jgi:iron-sulfur cluster assembly accessory protein
VSIVREKRLMSNTATEQANIPTTEKLNIPVTEKPNITVTEKAANKVKQIIAEQGTTEKTYLRLSVMGAGCSGYKNKLDLDLNCNEKTDEVFEVHGISVVVDKRSLTYLDGAKVDFHDELNRTGFSFVNPNAKSTCGCGSSYSM